MTTYSIDKVIRSAATFHLPNGDEAVCVLHFGTAAVCTQVDVNGAAAAWEQFWTTVIGPLAPKAFWTPETVLVQADARTVDPANPLASLQAIGIPGTAPNNSSAAENAWVTSLYSDLANRRGRGRVFMPAPAADRILNGSMSPFAVSTLNDCWTAFGPAILASDGIDHSVWSKTNGTARSVVGYITRSYIGHQRRRRA